MIAFGRARSEELDFLSKMQGKLHAAWKLTLRGVGRGRSPVEVDSYSHEHLSVDEIERVLDIAGRDNFVIYPFVSSVGFSLGFRVGHFEIGRDIRDDNLNGVGESYGRRAGVGHILLDFLETQLPEGYGFDRLSNCFMKLANVKKARQAGIEISGVRLHYCW